jgi:uncharacterized protein (TIGR03067 family)
MRPYLLLVPALGLLLGAAAAQDIDKDLKQTEGTWKVSMTEYDGKKVPQVKGKAVKLVVKGNEYVIFGEKEKTVGTLKVDSSKKPKTMDVMFSAGPLKGKVIRGIYELNDDTMRACFGTPDGERPTEFATKEGSGWGLFHYERVKKD